MRVSLVLMVSGFGKRYGANKLLEPFCGKPLFCWALEQAKKSGADHVTVVTAHREIQEEVLQHYPMYTLVWNAHPENGISESLKLGLTQEQESEGCCFLVGDQPLLGVGSFRRLLEAFRSHPDKICCCFDGKRRGSPVVFPSRYYQELLALEGDCGGKAVIRRHPEDILEVAVDKKEELVDIDWKSDIIDLKKICLDKQEVEL